MGLPAETSFNPEIPNRSARLVYSQFPSTEYSVLLFTLSRGGELKVVSLGREL